MITEVKTQILGCELLQMYISVTGLKPKGLGVKFWMHAVPCAMHCKKSDGLLHMHVERVDGWQHTFTAWTSREAMEAFLHSGRL